MCVFMSCKHEIIVVGHPKSVSHSLIVKVHCKIILMDFILSVIH